jgi:antitoxin component YwqK of YwqJK toxin-antitoxin module
MTNFSKLTIKRFNLLGSESDDEGVILNEVFYNEDGHEIERLNYTTEGDLEEHILVEIVDGKPVDERLEINGEVTERTTRTFDEKGRVSTEHRTYAEGGIDIITYEYDGDNLIHRIVTDEDGEEGQKEVREYNDGKIQKEISYDLFGNIEDEKTYEYDDEGKLSAVTEISYRGDLPEKSISFFDEAGRMTTEKKYDSKDRLIARTIIQYNEQNHPVLFEEESTRGKKITVLDYDESGNNTRQEETDGDGKRISLVERTFNENGHPASAEVIIEPTLYHPGQHYKLEYIYS